MFSRYPAPGRVKTRLLPVLSGRDCGRLHRALLQETLARFGSLSFRAYLYLTGCDVEAGRRLIPREAGPEKWRIRLQGEGDLGERLLRACQEVLEEASGVLLLGSDSPTLPLDYLGRAARFLRRRPVVLGPVEDGGYYLLGLCQARGDLFREIPWGTDQVFRCTMERLGRAEVALLPPWYDVDTPADLLRLREECREAPGRFPHLSRFLETLSPGAWHSIREWCRRQAAGESFPR